MNDMKDVFQDSKGYLWLACQEGFVRFDGARFVLFDKSNCPGLRENFIYDIEEDWEGNLWLATNGGGVSRFDGKSCTTFDTGNGLASNVVKRILIGRDQTIWFGTENGVTRLKKGIYSSYKFGIFTESQEVLTLEEDRRGNLLVGCAQTGLHVVRNDSTFTLPTDFCIHSFVERESGEIILGSNFGKLYVYNHNRVEKYGPYQLATPHTVRAIHEDQQGNLWFATEGSGILRYYDGHLEALTVETGLPQDHNFFMRVIEDREKSLWFVGDGGLLQLKDNKFTTFGRNEGLTSSFGSTVCEDLDGTMWAAFRNGGLAMFGRYNTRTLGAEDRLAGDNISAVFPVQDGGLWIGTNNGLNYFKDGRIREHWNEWNRYVDIRSLFESTTGELWITFALPEAGKVMVRIYSETGQLVRSLFDNEMQAGQHVVSWNRLNESGNTVAAGVYLYRLVVQRQNGETAFTETRRMTLVK
ncbi:hypothetical protein L0337_29180 [candidate division KSB1 bacterium]|nr:hypothetical protein [candidate division KSB1 bacterium]